MITVARFRDAVPIGRLGVDRHVPSVATTTRLTEDEGGAQLDEQALYSWWSLRLMITGCGRRRRGR